MKTGGSRPYQRPSSSTTRLRPVAYDSRPGPCDSMVGSLLAFANLRDEGVDGAPLLVQLDVETNSGPQRVFLPVRGSGGVTEGLVFGFAETQSAGLP